MSAQQFRYFFMLTSNGKLKRCLTISSPRVNVLALGNQRFYYVRVTLSYGDMERIRLVSSNGRSSKLGGFFVNLSS